MRRAGLLPGIVLLKTLISRIRNLSTEEHFPAWSIADVSGSGLFLIIQIFLVANLSVFWILQSFYKFFKSF